MDTEALATQVFGAVKDYVARSVKSLSDRFDQFDERLKTIPAGPKGDKGDAGPAGKGDPGRNGNVMKVGNGAPIESSSVGDFYIDAKTGDLYWFGD